MKSAYELAMERLEAADPDASKPLSDEQKQRLQEISDRYKAKTAEREVFLNKKLSETLAKGDRAEAEQIKTQLRNERLRIQEEMEAEKEKIRQEKAGS